MKEGGEGGGKENLPEEARQPAVDLATSAHSPDHLLICCGGGRRQMPLGPVTSDSPLLRYSCPCDSLGTDATQRTQPCQHAELLPISTSTSLITQKKPQRLCPGRM